MAAIEASYSWANSFLKAIRRSSKPVKRTQRHRWARMMAPKLERRLLAETVGDDLEPPALLDEQALEEISGPNEAPMGDGQSQVGDAARLEVPL